MYRRFQNRRTVRAEFAECKSDLQKEIMKCCILEEISDTDIANRLNISRQYVNRCKKRIFKKIIEEQDNL